MNFYTLLSGSVRHSENSLSILNKACFAIITLLFAFSSAAYAADDGITGDAAAGQAKAALCGACHGPEGQALQAEFPHLAGQGAKYIVKQLQDFKSGNRNNPIMLGMAAGLSDQDMADLGAHFESLPAAQGIAEDRQDLKLGESIYRGGVTSAGIPACSACHGPSGKGNPAAAWPALAGQSSTYLEQTLKHFRSEERANDSNSMMRLVAKRLSDSEIAALANYLQGLN